MADVLNTGLLELDEILSGEGTLRRGELSVFVAMPPTSKTIFWRQQLERAMEDGKTAVYIDYEMKPTDSLSDLGATPPDKPIKV
jgi:KaiC/GvpD/RAD55 family RecA-like ATPase